ncbi:MAG: LamG-like jellyroll fold domain-containing protein [Verrucomicrobiota bacterium]
MYRTKDGGGGGSMRNEWHDLIDGYLAGEVTEEQVETLSGLLREDETARAEFIRAADLQANLAVDESLWSKSESGAPIASVSQWPRWQIAAPWGIAAALAWALVAVLTQPPGDKATVGTTKPVLGLLVDEAGAKFEEGFGPENVRFDPGDYRLQEGAIHLRLENGADVIMGSPVEFRIDDSFHFALHRGSLRAFIPPSAVGFTVAAPGIDYEDLGTEFGVSVDPESGGSELHVFDGQVDAKSPDSKQILSSVLGGEAIAFSQGSLEAGRQPNEERFLTQGRIGFLRWQQQRARMEGDPDILAYFPFEESDVLSNTAVKPVATDGEIEGARWVSGRWPGKSALLFDRDTDFVELDLPGEFEALTFAAWVKLDSLDLPLNSLFNSNGRKEGDIHWEVMQDGSMILVRRFGHERQSRLTKLKVPTGKWVHLVGTISVTERQSRVYLNGELAGVDEGPLAAMTPGTSRIGHWHPIFTNESHRRELRGRIDEFAIWNRVLTEQEIQELTEAGKPNALWSARTD